MDTPNAGPAAADSLTLLGFACKRARHAAVLWSQRDQLNGNCPVALEDGC